MSRIDEALQSMERESLAIGGTIAPEVVAPVSRRAKLEHYPGEGHHGAHEPTEDLVQRIVAPRAVEGLGHLEGSGKLIGRGTPAVQVEQYRRLAAALHDAQIERGLKTVMITSAAPREGKTLTAVNLALTLHDSYGRRVLLVDADLRWPSIHEVLGLRSARGLSEALQEDGLEPPIVDMTPNWSVLLAGQPGPNPLAGLTSERMGILLDQFESRFDWVLLDTPPVGFLPDARLLARLIRSVVFVIGAGSTPAPVVERAVAEIGAECILGAVLNRVDENDVQHADYHSYYSRASEPQLAVKSAQAGTAGE